MISYQKIAGAKAADTAKKYTPSDLQGIAHIPNWAFLIQGDYFKDQSILNRVTGSMIVNNQTPEPASKIEIDANGNKLLSTDASDGKYFRFSPDSDISPNEHTFVFVVKAADKQATIRSFLINSANDDKSGKSVSIGFSFDWSALNYYGNGGSNGAPVLISYNLTHENKANLTLYVVSFSTTRGFTIRVNGKEVARSTTDLSPRSSQNLASQYYAMRAFVGRLGLLGLINKDLTLAENSYFLSDLESTLKDKYKTQ